MCPECGNQLVPIHYGEVTHAEIHKVIAGVLFIADKYGLENYYCQDCKIKLKL